MVRTLGSEEFIRAGDCVIKIDREVLPIEDGSWLIGKPAGKLMQMSAVDHVERIEEDDPGELARLRAENAKLREALEQIANYSLVKIDGEWASPAIIARKALEESETK